MSYSRRELYAAGEPLGESVTRHKLGGGYVCGGGGGGGPSNVTSTVYTYQNSVPSELTAYAKDLLGKTQALQEAPYQVYPNKRISDLSPLQSQTIKAIGHSQVPAQIGVASTHTNDAIKELLKYKYTPAADYTTIGMNALATSARRADEVDDSLNKLQYKTPFKDLSYSTMAPGLDALSKDYGQKGSAKVEQLYGDIPKVSYNNRAGEVNKIADDINGGDLSYEAYLRSLSNGGR